MVGPRPLIGLVDIYVVYQPFFCALLACGNKKPPALAKDS
jgi:hypothetical protein